VTWFTSNNLTNMRADVAKMLPDTCVIKSATTSEDTSGGWSNSYAAVSGGTVACRRDPFKGQNSQIAQIAGRETIVELYQLTMPYDAPVDSHYRITYLSEDYEIVKLDDKHSANVSRRAIIRRAE
jgi:hypothetical protein